jgi:hypothetical protein
LERRSHPVRIDAKKHFYTGDGELFPGLPVFDGLDNPVHLPKEGHERGTVLGRELRLILLNQPVNARKFVLAPGNAMRKDVE